MRVLARDNADVNDAWTCDKGRFAFRHADLPGRVTMPLIRDRGLEPASFDEVFAGIAEWSRDGRVAFLSGGRLPDEDAYALAKLARVAFGTNDLDHRRTFHGGHAELLAAASPLDTTYRDVERAKVILVAGLDAEQEVPILNLRIRKAARRGAAVFVIHPRRTRLWDVADHTLCLPEHQTYVLERIHDGDAPEDSFEGRVSRGPARGGRRGRRAGGRTPHRASAGRRRRVDGGPEVRRPAWRWSRAARAIAGPSAPASIRRSCPAAAA